MAIRQSCDIGVFSDSPCSLALQCCSHIFLSELTLNCSVVWAVGFNPLSRVVPAVPPLSWGGSCAAEPDYAWVHFAPCWQLVGMSPASGMFAPSSLGSMPGTWMVGAMACCSSSPWDLAAFLSFPSLVRNSCLFDRRVSARLLLLISLGQVLPR